MGLFNNNAQLEKKVKDLELVKQLDKGKHDKALADRDNRVSKLESKVELLKSEKDNVEEKLNFYVSLEFDQAQIESDKKKLRTEKEDHAEDVALFEHKRTRLEKRFADFESELEKEESDQFKRGYSDGLADGLRKAHDITREDRKYMTMIAMSTNQSKAIETSVKALESGFKDDSNTKG
jgi:flagellar biosynthesis/type III secretory pathway protein FliH